MGGKQHLAREISHQHPRSLPDMLTSLIPDILRLPLHILMKDYAYRQTNKLRIIHTDKEKLRTVFTDKDKVRGKGLF